MSDQPDCVITIRPRDGKPFSELQEFVFIALQAIRAKVPGIVHAYPFIVSGKEEIIVLEKFVSNAVMFEYFTSEYHESLVSQLLPFTEEPIDIRSYANISDLEEWKKATAGQFTV